MRLSLGLVPALFACLGISARAAEPPPHAPFTIEVVDRQTGRGVPLVELRTTGQVAYVTDSNGIVAFDEPGLLGTPVHFSVSSHGYEFTPDGFGFRGVKLDTAPGGSARIEVDRRNIAERLYRVTGAGIYRDSVLAGRPVPIRQPLLNAQVVGQDSVQAAPFGGRIYWFWGDTARPGYPLGLFRAAGATSPAPGEGGLDPASGIDLEYFTGPDGFAREMFPSDQPGAIWFDGLLVAPDAGGTGRLVCHYARVKDLGTVYEGGLGVYDEEKGIFLKRVELASIGDWRCPRGQTTRATFDGADYFVFATPFATVRVPAQLDAVLDPARYEAFTCLAAGAEFAGKETKLELGPDGRPVWSWKVAAPITPSQEAELVAAGKIAAGEARLLPRDADGGTTIVLHAGSIRRNAYRNKWVMIANQIWGKTSLLGEVYYLEADEVTGPWSTARKIVTHDRYSFYNPVHHDFLDGDGGRFIYFEGTYAGMFSREGDLTPRYDYNQMMYRLDLSDPRLGDGDGGKQRG